MKQLVPPLKWVIALSYLLITFQALAQINSLTGKVTDENNQGIPGVNVLEKGTSNGTVTGTDGSYSLRLNNNGSVVVFSYIGYTTEEMSVNNQAEINVKLVPDLQTLGEVVVVGYGEQQKKDLTGAISSVNAKDIQKIQVSSVDQALQGQIAGVQISTTSGAPGGNVNVLIRGVSSITGGVQPLFVIDGYPVSNAGIGNPLNTINPNDIESVDVLKDASATAIYGSRGSNGVIIITTKRGKSGAPRIEFDSYMGFQEVGKKLDLMNAQEFAGMVVDARNAGYLDNFPNGNINDNNTVRPGVNFDISDKYRDPSTLPTTDWQDAIFRRAPINNYQLSATGGTESIRYAVSGGYFSQEGIIINSGLKRYNFRANLDGQLSKNLAFGVSLLPSYTQLREVPASGHYGALGIIASATGMDPSVPVYNEDGSYGNTIPPVDGNAAIQNPVKIANELQNPSSQFRILSNAYLEYTLLEGLKLRSSFGVDLNYYKSNLWNPSTLSSSAPTGPATARASNTENTNWLSETTLSYKKNLGGDHLINILGGFTAQRAYNNSVTVTAGNFPDDLITNINGGIVNGGNQNIEVNNLVSLLARANYSYKDKYLLTATVRSDGSSRFGKNNRWGTFPSASIGWRISNENFMSNITFVNDLKLRASYGVTGNNAIGNYRAISLLGSNNYVIGDAVVPGLAASSLSNNDLSWESQSQLDIGIDLSVWNGRVNITSDYYDKRNKDMLFNIQTPSATGFTNAFVNVGEVQNKGIELGINTRNLVGEFQWSTSFNITFNKNKVLAMNEETARIFGSTAPRANSNVTQVGYPIGVFYGRRAIGIFNSDQEAAEIGGQPNAKAGDIRWKDVNEDGKIDDNDREVIGNPNPDFFFGFNNSFSYKGFTLDITTNGMYGQDVYNAMFAINNSGVQNNLSFIDEARWRSPEEPGSSQYGRLWGRAIRGGLNGNTSYSSLYIFDASYWRIRNITLAYTLPAAWLKNIKVQNARVYVAANNLYTFTKYIGYDPEVGIAESNQTAFGVDFGTYPLNRSFTLGLNLSF
ncbi:TonB-dependent receptor [Rhodocytophaga aerolata]|uniref:TonB-dependent receptor n=1 Tax=Rhodocytophaga aerolata TaxID=455078 RepID=A0ABT8RFV5_9BACT|nr:TonB-dependent receptor [Rhodocytophaga aerolata]MDO1449680.1 TonB-dependent receptor [Rhodocytophaga aerolata]